MAAAYTDITVPNTLTPVISQRTLDGVAQLFIRNLGAVAINVEVYYYPDGVTPVRDGTLVPDLSAIAAGTNKLVDLPRSRPDQLSVSAAAASATCRLLAYIIQPTLRRARTRMGQ